MRKSNLLEYLLFSRKKKVASLMLSPASWITKAIHNEQANVLQIGSNDGKTRDPLFKIMKERNQWKGLFVEPVPYLFERLKNNYLTLDRSERFQFSNTAVNDGTEEYFYYVDKHAKYVIPDLPEWYDQIGSFNREHILGHMEGKFEPFIQKIKIRGIKLSDLLKQFNIKRIDLFHLDTEGYDWLILSQLDLKKYQPIVILYEHKHLSGKDYHDSLKFLSELYDVFQFKNDCLCLHRDKHGLTVSDLANLRRVSQVV